MSVFIFLYWIALCIAVAWFFTPTETPGTSIQEQAT
jgi:hypothetical protein